jgi:hypothetical protein
MIVDIPDELAERVRHWINVNGWEERNKKSAIFPSRFIVRDLAALLPEPDPLDVLAAEDGWERDYTTVVWRQGQRGVRTDGWSVWCWGNYIPNATGSGEAARFECADPAAAAALARNLRTALEQAGEGT